MGDSTTTTDVEDVFGVIANETRFEILLSLWEAYTEDPESIEGPEQDPVSFSELRSRVGVRDSGRFNYHLDELIPQFVRHHDDGYALTYAGARVIGAATSGVYTDADAEFDTTAVRECPGPDCHGELQITYEAGHARLECDTCSRRYVLPVPPVLVQGHDVETVVDTVREYSSANMHKIVRGFCTLCSGPLEAWLDRSHLDGGEVDGVRIAHECQECSNVSHTGATAFVRDHPAVVSSLHEAGIDYRSTTLWNRPEGVEFDERVRSEEPLRIEITVTVEDDTITLVLDEEFEVVESSEVES